MNWVSQHIETFLVVTLTCFVGTGVTWLSTQKDLKQENENSLGKNIFKAQIFKAVYTLSGIFNLLWTSDILKLLHLFFNWHKLGKLIYHKSETF